MQPGSNSPEKSTRRSPGAEYQFQLDSLEVLQRIARQRGRIYGISKLVIAAAVVIAAGFLIHRALVLLVLLLPAAAFVIVAVLHERMLQAMRRRDRAIRFYRDGLARLKDEWRGRGEAGERFLHAAHPYARDLDLFGDASLFQYLSTARTRAGEEMLARWLQEPASVEEIASRQHAVRDLAARLKFRERIASAGEPVRAAVDVDALAAWGEAKPVFASPATRIAVMGLAILWICSLAAWARWGTPLPVLLVSLLNFAYAHRVLPQVDRAAVGIEKTADDLRMIAAVLALIEEQAFTAERLQILQDGLKSAGAPPCGAIRKLARLADLIESRHSLFARPLDLVTFWSAQLVFRAEQWQRKFGPELRGWIAAVGTMEALASLGSFTFEHPEHVFPEFDETRPLFDAQGIAHPLLPIGKAVDNDVRFDGERQLMILSGPNMAGKSTFMRSIGVNAVLAQCGAPVRARRLRMSRLQVAASMCILDSLTGGVSLFYAEIRRVKMIADLAQLNVPVLFLLDELLSGTNSHDRLVGTEFVLRELVAHGAIGIVSTHDLALTHIPESMGGRGFNAHFEDRVEGETLIFDYRLKPGVVQTSNALKLMRSIGLGVSE